MIQDRIADRYAKSLYSLAASIKEVDKVKTDFEQISSLLEASADFRQLVRSPIITAHKKEVIFEKLLSGKVTNYTLQLILLLTRRSRESLLPFISRAFLAEYNRHNNIQTAELITAEALSEAQKENISKQLAKATGKTITLTETIQPNLIGGFILRSANKQFDGSVSGALRQIHKEFTQQSGSYIEKI